MRKKWVIWLSSLYILVFGILQASQEIAAPRQRLIEFKSAYYYPSHKIFRDIYRDATLFSLEGSVQVWKGAYTWGSIGTLNTKGYSIGGNDKTTLYAIPIGLGVKYLYRGPEAKVNPYLGAGLIVAYAHIHNDSRFVAQNQVSWDAGCVVKSGFLANLTKKAFFDFFFDYTYLKMTFNQKNHSNLQTNSTYLSGLSIGVGLGARY